MMFSVIMDNEYVGYCGIKNTTHEQWEIAIEILNKWKHRGFSKGKTILYMGHQKGKLPAKNGLSDAVRRDLKKRGFKYLGSVTVYSHLQACGIINDHGEGCFRYRELMEGNETIRKRRDKEA